MSDCSFWDVSCKISDTVAKAEDDVVSKWAENIMDGVNKTLATLSTIWVNVKTNVGSSDSVAKFIQGNTTWLVVLLAAGAMIVAAMQMAWNQRGEPLKDVLAGLIRLIVVSAAVSSIVQLILEISDIYSPWIIQLAAGEDDGKFLVKILDMSKYTTGGLGMIVIIVGGLLALLTNISQIFLMFVRSGLLTLLTGFFPLAAAASTTKWGQQWFGKYIAWVMAFVAFKPTAATIYAASIKLLSGDSYEFTDDIGSFLMGIIFLILAVVALPALVVFLVPVSANLGGGGGGSAAMVGGALATGASSVAHRSFAKGGGFKGGSGKSNPGPSSPQAPTGASTPGGGGGQAGMAMGSKSAAGGAGSSGAAAAGGGGGAAAAGGGAGAAAGPVGAAVVAGVQAVGAGVSAAKNAAQSTADQTVGSQGASGAAPVAAPNAVGGAGPSGSSGVSGRQGGRGPSGDRGSSSSSGGGGRQSTGAREVHKR